MSHRFVEHVGELEVELDAGTEAGVFEAALTAFADLVDQDALGARMSHEVDLEASDRALLLVDWLNELVFLAEVARFVPVRVSQIELSEGKLHATIEGHRDHPRHLVKAVTLNRLELAEEGGIWRGRVVLDV